MLANKDFVRTDARCSVCDKLVNRCYYCLVCEPELCLCVFCYNEDMLTVQHTPLHAVRYTMTRALRDLCFGAEYYPHDVPQTLRCAYCQLNGLSDVDMVRHMRLVHNRPYYTTDQPYPLFIMQPGARTEYEILKEFRLQAEFRNAAVRCATSAVKMLRIMPLQKDGNFAPAPETADKTGQTAKAVKDNHPAAIKPAIKANNAALVEADFVEGDDDDYDDYGENDDPDYDEEVEEFTSSAAFDRANDGCWNSDGNCRSFYAKTPTNSQAFTVIKPEPVTPTNQKPSISAITQTPARSPVVVTSIPNSDNKWLLSKFLIEPEPVECNPTIQQIRAECIIEFFLKTARSMAQ